MRWFWTVPFGRPVEPEVKRIQTEASGDIDSSGFSVESPASSSSMLINWSLFCDNSLVSERFLLLVMIRPACEFSRI